MLRLFNIFNSIKTCSTSLKGSKQMFKCAIIDDYQNVALQCADWKNLKKICEITTFQNHFSSKDQLIDNLNPYDIIVIMRERTIFDRHVLSSLNNLKLLVTSGMRNAAIDLEAAADNNIVVSGTRSLSEPAAELTWALMLGLSKNLYQENNSLRQNGIWQSRLGVGLQNKTLGIIGLGKIGSQVAKIGQAFGMNIIAWSQNLDKTKTDEMNIVLAENKEELLRKSDFVSIHVLLSARTKNLITINDLRLMKHSSYLINTSRAPIVNELDLIQALQANMIAGAGLDVFDIEPLPESHPFRAMNNVLATPHIGYVTKENYAIYFNEAIENIKAFHEGHPIRLIENPSNRILTKTI